MSGGHLDQDVFRLDYMPSIDELTSVGDVPVMFTFPEPSGISGIEDDGMASLWCCNMGGVLVAMRHYRGGDKRYVDTVFLFHREYGWEWNNPGWTLPTDLETFGSWNTSSCEIELPQFWEGVDLNGFTLGDHPFYSYAKSIYIDKLGLGAHLRWMSELSRLDRFFAESDGETMQLLQSILVGYGELASLYLKKRSLARMKLEISTN
ncbi:hypothetical protein JW710_04345 [Candidatus Dojkabacteria bacterium]|nr:hypothetical protein [Candidatus Dojkabacteria bacterium]